MSLTRQNGLINFNECNDAASILSVTKQTKNTIENQLDIDRSSIVKHDLTRT